MIEVGNIVKSKYAISGHRARIGLVVKMREGAYESQPLAQIYWPHSRTFGWVEAIDMEIVDESR
tara:strand:- start:302 stop:493 length:192 start_codon:yes stop_codon:yes gene_type:complete